MALIFPPEVAALIFGMFVIGAIALSVALRAKLGNGLEQLSRRTRWWVRGLTLAIVLAIIGLVFAFKHVLGS
ncbi:MAG TPA: hypothetical protein VM734_25835 [Kofleriaceae bacterium]|jgi:hypothetical protein|nr:hypothetical protein [Kofleriaceae bacterium]